MAFSELRSWQVGNSSALKPLAGDFLGGHKWFPKDGWVINGGYKWWVAVGGIGVLPALRTMAASPEKRPKLTPKLDSKPGIC